MKKLLIALGISLIAIVAMVAPCFADSPSTTTVTWGGDTNVTGVVTTGATTTNFAVNAGGATGTFTATDSNDNPYSYGVDTNSAYISGNFTNGGTMSFQTVRNTSYVPMYGTSGQTVYTFVGSSGTGAMATGSSTNYAGMTNGTYGQPHTANGYNFEASGSSYQIQQTISSTNAWAGFNSVGNGTAQINDMTTGAYGATSANLGFGGGCYTNANATMTGAGQFTVSATGSNSITTPAGGNWSVGGTGTYGSATLTIVANFNNGFSVGDYSTSVR